MSGIGIPSAFSEFQFCRLDKVEFDFRANFRNITNKEDLNVNHMRFDDMLSLVEVPRNKYPER